ESQEALLRRGQVHLPRSTYGAKMWVSARRWWKARAYAGLGIFEYFVSQGRSARGDCSRQKDTSDHMTVKRDSTCASMLTSEVGISFHQDVCYLMECALHRLSIGGLSRLREMRSLSGETRYGAATIDVVSMGPG